MQLKINAGKVTQGTRKIPVELLVTKPVDSNCIDLIVKIIAYNAALDCVETDVNIIREFSNPICFQNPEAKKLQLKLEFRRPKGEYELIVEARYKGGKTGGTRLSSKRLGRLIESATKYFLVDERGVFCGVDSNCCLEGKAALCANVPNKSILSPDEGRKLQLEFDRIKRERDELVKQRVKKTLKNL